jgi:chloramphenicol 3-O-phosphotransferase
MNLATHERRYSDLRADLKTGDLVFFSGQSAFSRAVQLFSASPWSHVGMVLNLPQYDFICLYEATALFDVRDLDSGVFRDGVQLVPLSQRLEQY